eukprot:1177374-Pleurochrysis_carterae.AAC.1
MLKVQLKISVTALLLERSEAGSSLLRMVGRSRTPDRGKSSHAYHKQQLDLVDTKRPTCLLVIWHVPGDTNACAAKPLIPFGMSHSPAAHYLCCARRCEHHYAAMVAGLLERAARFRASYVESPDDRRKAYGSDSSSEEDPDR